MTEIKYQEDEDSEVVCCSCKHNIRCPVKGDLAHIECYCAKDNHYINYLPPADMPYDNFCPNCGSYNGGNKNEQA